MPDAAPAASASVYVYYKLADADAAQARAAARALLATGRPYCAQARLLHRTLCRPLHLSLYWRSQGGRCQRTDDGPAPCAGKSASHEGKKARAGGGDHSAPFKEGRQCGGMGAL